MYNINFCKIRKYCTRLYKYNYSNLTKLKKKIDIYKKYNLLLIRFYNIKLAKKCT